MSAGGIFMRKVTLSFLLMYLAASPFAQTLDGLTNYTNDKSAIANITAVYNAACPQDGKPDDCRRKLNYDSYVFTIRPEGNSALILFLLSRGFGVKAYYIGEEVFNLMARLQMPYDEQSAQVFKSVIETAAAPDPDFKPYERNNEIFKELVTAQNLRTGYSPLHNIALYTPVNKNFQLSGGAAQNRLDSFQSLLADALGSNPKLQPYYCDALSKTDKSGDNALNIAVNNDNKEAFYNLITAAKNAKCDLGGVLGDANSKTSVRYAAAKNDKKNKDGFYNNVINLPGGGVSPDAVQQKLLEAGKNRQDNIKKVTADANAIPGNGGNNLKGTAGITIPQTDKTSAAEKQEPVPAQKTAAETKQQPAQKPQNVPPDARRDSKKLPVTDANLEWAKSNIPDKQMKEAAKMLNRVDAGKVLNSSAEYMQGYAHWYKKTMKAKGSPFARLDINKENKTKVNSAYEDAVRGYIAKNLPDDAVVQKKLADCAPLTAKWRLKPKKFNTNTSGLDDIQYGIIDASGAAYVSDPCFDSMRGPAKKTKTPAPVTQVKTKKKDSVADNSVSEATQVTQTPESAPRQSVKEAPPAAEKKDQSETQTTANKSPVIPLEDVTVQLPLVKNKHPGPMPAVYNINKDSLSAYYGADNFDYIGRRAELLAALSKDILNMAAEGQSNTPEFSTKYDALKKGILGLSKDIKGIKMNADPALLYYKQLSQ